MKQSDDTPRIFHILRDDALQARTSPFGSVETIFRGGGIEAVWEKREREAIDPHWFSHRTVDLILIVQGKLTMEFERPDLAACVLEPGDLAVLPPETRCRAYRWPCDAENAALFFAMYPAV